MTDDTTATVVTDAGSAISETSSSEVSTPAPGSEGTQTPNVETQTAEPIVAAEPATTDTPEAATPGLEDILNSIPENDDDLNDPNIRDVEARRNMRSQLRVLSEAIKPLRTLEPLAELAQYGEPNTIKNQLEAYNSLFTQVVDPATQQPQFDESGLPKVSAAKFIEQVDTENPGLAETMLNDLLRYAPELPNGQKVSFYERALREVYRLDPKRLDDYRNIDALTVPTGEVTPEELAAIPENQRDAYKTLPKSLRDAWENIPDDERKFHLDGAHERIEARQYRETETQRQAEVQQQQVATARQQIVEAQDTYIREELQTGLATIMDDVAKQVTFSADPNTNAVMLGVTEGFVAALRDPDSSAFKNVQGALTALGVKLDSGFQEALSVADKHMRDQKAYELMGQKGLAQTSQTKANAAKTQVIAKLAPLAIKLAKALGGQAAQRANQQNQLLGAATNTRPTPGNGSQAETGTFGVPDMLPNDPRYGVALARQTGLLR